jgi:hypothetical protein
VTSRKAAPFLVPCLVSLRGEFNELAPTRDTESDGWIGDAAHQQEQSDHNPDATGAVHAIDVDRDLRRAGWSMERAVQITVGRHRSGLDERLHYVIFNRRIWASDWGWTEREYDGPNPHDKHAHFSARYTAAAERDVSPWGLLAAQEGEGMDAADFFASAARGVKGGPDATAADRANRNNAAVVVRFALGYNWNVQDGDDTVPDEKTVMGKLDQIIDGA